MKPCSDTQYASHHATQRRQTAQNSPAVKLLMHSFTVTHCWSSCPLSGSWALRLIAILTSAGIAICRWSGSCSAEVYPPEEELVIIVVRKDEHPAARQLAESAPAGEQHNVHLGLLR